MPENFVTLATFTEPAEAEMACARLQDEGIAAFCTGDIAAGVFPGLPATSLVQLQVPQAELERAREVLAVCTHQAEKIAEERSLFWDCPQCGKHTDYETEICPSCGALMEPPYDPDTALDQKEEEDEKETTATPPADTDSWVGNKLATRAFRAAIAGLFIWWPIPPIPLAALYSLFLLCRLVLYSGELSDSGVVKCLVAFVIDLFVVGVALVILWPLWLRL
jgi:predicted RNA-binding Zn-ribbon protein involved in translation (DUF1610 family)